jgi:hypothetical protein
MIAFGGVMGSAVTTGVSPAKEPIVLKPIMIDAMTNMKSPEGMVLRRLESLSGLWDIVCSYVRLKTSKDRSKALQVGRRDG